MSGKDAKVGLSSDLFDTNGRPMFGDAVLSLFSDADSFVEAVGRDAIFGIIAALNGHWPEYVVNPAARAHARVRTWMRAA